MTDVLRARATGVKALVAILFAGLFFFGLQAPAAHAVTLVDVTVNVTSKTGAALPDLVVSAFPVDGKRIVAGGVDADYQSPKQFKFTGLVSGQKYALYFNTSPSTSTAFDQFYGGTTFVEEATYLSWFSPNSYFSTTLATNSTFTGKVTGTGNAPLSGIAVYPWRWDGNDYFRLDGAATTTNAAGMYTMRDLEPGTYRLEFAPKNSTGYVSEFSGNTRVAENAAPLTLGLGATVTYNAMLAVGGTLTGRAQLTDSSVSGGNVASNDVTAVAFAVKPGGAIDTSLAYGSAKTGTDGKWTIKGLPAGNYKVKMYDTDTSPAYVDHWAIDQTHAIDAATYAVLAGKTTAVAGVTHLPFFLDTDNTSLTLTVKDAHNAVPSDATDIYILPTSGEEFSSSFKLIGGTATFPFVPPGQYTLMVDAHDSFSNPYSAPLTINATGGTITNVTLDAVSAFTYDTAPSIAETASALGTTYVVDPGHTSLDDGTGPQAHVTYDYIWLRGGYDTPIFGAQGPDQDTYTTGSADLSQKVSVIVRASAFGYPTVFLPVVATDSATTGPAPVNTVQPSIIAPATVVPGTVLTGDVGTWTPAQVSYLPAWTRDGSTVVSTALRYTVQPADAGHEIELGIYATRQGFMPGGAVASNTVNVGSLAAPAEKKASVFTTKLVAGDTVYTATPGTWSPVPDSYSYTWYADNSVVGTGSPFTCTAGDATCEGRAIEVVVSASRLGYTTGEKRYVVRKGTAVLTVAPGSDATVSDPLLGGTMGPTTPAQLGHTLHGTPPFYAYPSVAGVTTNAYQWQRQSGATFVNIPGATKQNYVPVAADVAKALRLKVTVTNTAYPTGIGYADAGIGSAKLDLLTGHPSFAVDGTGLMGTTKRIISGSSTWAATGVTQTYQWFACADIPSNTCASDTSATNAAWIAIAGAKSATYVPPVGPSRYILVQVTGSKTGYQSSPVRTDAFALDAGHNPDDITPFSSPTISAGLTGGQAIVGTKITVKPGTVDRTAGVTRVNLWQVCTDAGCTSPTTIAGQTGTTYVPTTSLFAAGNAPRWVRMVEQVSVGSTGFGMMTAAVPVKLATQTPKVAPSFTTSGSAGNTTYTVTNGTWPVAGTTFTYQWFHAASAGAITRDDTSVLGTDPVWVVITAHAPGYADVSRTLVPHKGVLPTQTPAVPGAVVGNTMSLTGPLNIPVNVPAASFKYQWYSGSSMIAGATKATFVPSASYVGKLLKLRITVTSSFYATATVYSAIVPFAAHPAPVGTVTIVSTPSTFAPGAKLTAATTFGSGFTYTYKWERSPDGTTWSTISTASSYTLSTSDPDQKFRVTVTPKKTGWLSAPVASSVITANHTNTLQITATPNIGEPKVDKPLTVSTAWNTTGVTLTYSWSRNGVTIPGATSATITPTASWYTDELQAHVTATKPGWVSKTVETGPYTVSQGDAPTSTLTITPAAKVGTLLTANTAWNVAGLQLVYLWTLNGTPMSADSTYTPNAPGTLVLTIDATRFGYLPGSVTKTVTVAP